MKERILKIIERERMTPSRFAESIGIQRSAMSHIISGRNNPSLDMVTKILERYPYIHTDWLLFGKGEMCNEENSSRPDAFLSAENTIIFTEGAEKPEYRKETEVKQPVSESKDAEIEKVIYQEKPARTISKIMVFYSDNTFDTFVAEKKDEE